jgi:hypothetical protein
MIETLSLLKNVKLFKLTLMQYNSGVVKTIWNSTFRKLKLYLSCKTNSIHFKYFVKDVLILRAECIKDLGVMVDSKLYFHCHVDFVYSQALRTLGLIRCITYNFSSLDSLVVLHIALIRSKLEYASVVWNKLTSTDSNKIENIQRQFASLCYYRFFFCLFSYVT